MGDTTDSGGYIDLAVVVTANTSLPNGDATSDADPYYTVSIDDEQVVETDEVSAKSSTRTKIRLPPAALERHAGSTVTLNITLWEGDLAFDEYIASKTTKVSLAAAKTTIQASGTEASSTSTSSETTSITTERVTTVTETSAATTTRTTPSTTTTTTPPTTTTTTEPQTSWQVTVVRVVDGDTLEVRFPDGHTEDVRLLGVDTPEVHVENDPDEFEGIPSSSAGEDWLRDWGHKASEFARTRLLGETVTIRTDPTADRRGSYGRLLVYVFADSEQSFNGILIERGYARLYDSTFTKRSTFASLESTAQSNNVGLWNYDEPETTTSRTTTPTDGGSGETGELEVVNVHADADGNDHENENDEYIVFKNTGDVPLDLSGWTVSDAADHTYTFPDVTVEPGETVTLYTGSGTTTDSEAYWQSDRAIWNNGGDTIIVTNADGEVVIRYEY